MIMSTKAESIEKIESPASLQEHQTALLKLLVEFDRICTTLNIPYILFAGTMLGAVRHQGFIPWDDDLDVLMLREDYERFLNEAEQALDQNEFYLQKEFSEHWPMFFSKLRLNNTTCLEKYHPKDPDIHQGVYIDIFPCDSSAKSNWVRKLQFYASKVVIAKSLLKRGYETDNLDKKMFMGVCRFLPLSPFLWFTKKGGCDSEYVHSFLGAASRFSKNVYPREIFRERIDVDFEGGAYPVPVEYDRLLKIIYGDYMQLPPPEQRVVKKHAVLVDLDNSYEQYRDYHKNMKFDIHTKSIR